MRVTHFLVCTLPDNPVHAAAGKLVTTDWNHDHVIEFDSADVVTALGYTPVTNARTVSAGAGLSGGGDLSANRTISLDLASANVWTATQTVPRLVAATGTITASEPVLDLSQTWNAGAIEFTGIKLNVTNTASTAASLLQDWQVDGVSRARITSTGTFVSSAPAGYGNGAQNVFYSNAGANYGLFQLDGAGNMVFRQSQSSMYFDFFSALYFRKGSSLVNVLTLNGTQTELLNSTTAQTFRVYGTYTDSSNYVRASLSSSSTAITLAAETAGTGADNVPVNITPAGTEGVQIGNFAQLTEMTAPAAGAANTARIYAEDNGGGKTRLMVIFASGAAQQIAIEP